MCYVFCCIAILSLILLFFIPESPHWLITFRNDTQGAARSLRQLYHDNEVIKLSCVTIYALELIL